MLKSLWINHYQKPGLIFPEENVNGIVWGIWSLMYASAILNIAKRFSVLDTTLLSRFVAFPMMWVVLGNLTVLPHNLMLYATPLSLLETFVAAFIIRKFSTFTPSRT